MLLAKAKLWLLHSITPSFTMKRRAWPIMFGLCYVAAIYFLGGLQSRHVMMGLGIAFLAAYNETTDQFLQYFFPFMLTGILYDSMRYYYWWGIAGHIHVAQPYYLEKSLFGIKVGNTVLTPNEFWQRHTYKILDFFCGIAYLTFVFEYLATGFGLYFTKRLHLLKTFGWCFFLVNAMGFATYYIYPAAPPWYVALYGLGPAIMHAHASPAGAARFDALFGTHFFTGMYGQSVDVYGAYPSLHVSYPLLVMWVSLVSKKFRLPAIVFYFLMCFSAIYLDHHYVVDIIMGTTYALVALLIVRAVHNRDILKETRWYMIPVHLLLRA